MGFFARTEQEENTQLDVFQQVSDICALVATAISEQDLLEQSLQQTMQLVGATRGSIFLLDPNGKDLTLKTAIGLKKDEQKQMVKKMGEGIIGHVAKRKLPIVVDDIETDDRFHDFKARKSYQTPSFICAPLIIKDKLIGVINITDKESGLRFTKNEMQLLDFLSSQIALNYRRIELYQKFKNIVRETQTLKDRLGQSDQEAQNLKKQIHIHERLATIGKLAGGIAHEFNNPLDGVMRYTNLCLEHIKDDEVVRGYLLEIKHGLNRMANIVRNLLACSRNELPHGEQRISFQQALDRSLAGVHTDIEHKNIEVEKKIAGDIPLIRDLGLERILANVIRNAVEAIESDSGKITVEAECHDGTLHIKVGDTGVGIATGDAEKIFEPFYTTKSINKGCGLGLTIVSEIVKSYNGKICVENEPGKQTTFHRSAATIMIMVNKTDKNVQILIVDDEPLIRKSLYEILRIEGYRVQMAETGEDALGILKKERIDIVVTDFQLPKMNGIQLLEEIKRWSPKTEVILVTGYGTIESAVAAMKKGAFDYITKPINDSEIKIIIQKLIEKKQIVAENEELKQIIAKGRRDHFCDLIGASPKIQEVYRIIDSVASSNATILITGESGTGKGLIARAIHQTDQTRKDKPFVEISCGALTETLLESELFGHMKGAFTGAIKDKEGRFEYAHGGTIFLDEIDAFSPTLQVKLLRVLQEGIFERVGDNIPRRAEARIIVATNQNLTELVRQGKFREDLYYRVNVICVHIPSLRERKEDLAILIDHFLKKYSRINNKKVANVAEDVRKIFLEYHWPGNIRELENAIEGAVIMAKTGTVHRTDIPNVMKFAADPRKSTRSPERNLKRAVEQPEKEHIISILKDCNWNRNKAAASLGVNRTTLYNKMKKYNINEETI